MNWNSLVEEIKRGSPVAGPTLVSVVAPVLDEIASHLAPDLGQASQEECVERALTKVVEKIDLFDQSRGSLLSWAKGFLRHEIADSRRRRVTSLDPATIAQIPESETTGALHGPECDALARIIAEHLSPVDQTLLHLHIQENMKFALIAEILGPPANAASLRKRYQRARETVISLAKEDSVLRPVLEGQS